MKLTKSQLKEIIREEIQSLLENKDTIFNSFKKDFKDVVLYAGAYLEGNKIKIYLDNDPNKEKNIINKLVRTKYSDKLKKVRSEDDVMIFKITESKIVENKSKEANSKNVNDNDMFISHNGPTIKIQRKFLKQDKVRELVDKLNKHGFKLGSGHDLMVLKKVDDDNFVLRLQAFPGSNENTIHFKRIE